MPPEDFIGFAERSTSKSELIDHSCMKFRITGTEACVAEEIAVALNDSDAAGSEQQECLARSKIP